jgi:sugar lactone lactonase YvrE
MTAANSPVGIAVDPSTEFVYWTDVGNSTVTKMSTGDAGAPITVAAAQSNPTSLVLDGTYVYWTNAVANGSVLRLTK